MQTYISRILKNGGQASLRADIYYFICLTRETKAECKCINHWSYQNIYEWILKDINIKSKGHI